MKNILCIDDIESNLYTLKSVLDSSTKELYNVMLSNSADAGLNVLLREKIDLILLDIMMPEVDGFACAKMIRSNKKTKDIPIIFVTAKTDDQTIEECYGVGGNDYLMKPFNNVELLARVNFHLRLKEDSELLKKEKEYNQNLLDLQENIIFVTDTKELLSANRALLDFFHLNSLKEFQLNHKCICESFIQDDGFFSLDMVQEDKSWVDELMELSTKDDVLVKMIQDEQEYIFQIKASKFLDKYILSLTDITQISQQSQQYRHEANYDELTQIYSRNMLHRVMNKKISDQQEEKYSFVFMIMDIDFFKKVNDTYGHLVGDEVLKSLTALIKKHIRTEDTFARWGGEEFILVLNAEMNKGLEIAENLRNFIEVEHFDTVKNITCSFGITEYREKDTLDTLIHRADDALYEAKAIGRNRVCQR